VIGSVETRVRQANLVTREPQLDQLFGADLSARLLEEIRHRLAGTASHPAVGDPVTEIENFENTKRRSDQMDTTTTVDTKSPSPAPPRRWMPALVAATAVFVLGVPAVLLLGGSPFGGSSPTAVEIAEAYIEARNAYDSDRARELVAQGFVTTEPPDAFSGLEQIELAFQTHGAYGIQYTQGECRADANTVPTMDVVRCEYQFSSELHRIAELPPQPVSFTFVIEDGRITSVVAGSHLGRFWDRFVDDFLQAEGHHEFLTQVELAVDSLDPDATRAVVEGMPHYLDLYRAWTAERRG
jgi:hypothetical protein